MGGNCDKEQYDMMHELTAVAPAQARTAHVENLSLATERRKITTISNNMSTMREMKRAYDDMLAAGLTVDAVADFITTYSARGLFLLMLNRAPSSANIPLDVYNLLVRVWCKTCRGNLNTEWPLAGTYAYFAKHVAREYAAGRDVTGIRATVGSSTFAYWYTVKADPAIYCYAVTNKDYPLKAVRICANDGTYTKIA